MSKDQPATENGSPNSETLRKTYKQGFFSQLLIMMKRNTILQYRYLNSTVSQALVAPLLFTLLIFVLQKADHQNQSVSNPHPPLGALDGVQQCQGRDPGSPCVSIFFTPDNTTNGVNYRDIMQVFSKKNAERTGYEFKVEDELTDAKATIDKVYDIVPVSNSDFIYDFTLQHPNTTAWGVSFSQPATGPEINIQYQLWFNATNNANGTDIFGRQVLSFVRGLDEAIITVLNDPSATVTADIDVSLKDWPLIPPSKLSDSIVQQLGPTFFFCSEMLIFINVLNQIVTEKELKLRHGMEVMGLRPSVYWISQYLSNSLLVLINAIFTSFWGWVFRFQAFTDTNFLVLVITFFLFGEAMVMLAFAITTVVRRSRIAILIGIFIFIIGLLFESFVYSGSFLGYIWWNEKALDPNVANVLSLLVPFFNFGHMFLDITSLTTGLLDVLTDTYIPGPGFGWGALYEKIPNDTLPIYGSDGRPNVPYPVDAWYCMLLNIAIYAVILWYLDTTIPNEFGMSRPLWFFLTPDYWGFQNNSTQNLKNWQDVNMAMSQPDEENEDSDVVAERKKVFDGDYFPSLKILNLRKVYSSIFSKEKKVAVRNSCFAVEKGNLLALLGQNGAGKSTTISMLSGLTPATSGDALIFNYSVKKNISSIRSIMGICPQHDILFDDLTAREHIELYAGLKGVPNSDLEELINNRLQMVRLLSVADVRAGTYSGGMKRRLSLVISTIGDPQIIFLDEPTTGMDPVNRRHVWAFIEKFKKDRVIVLTTHSMEEADVLGDRICVMSKGRLRAINNSIALKNKFGEGYRISVVVDQKESENAKKIVSSMIPGAKLEDDSAGALIYQFPSSSINAIPEFVEWLENNKDGIVKSWGISQSTLEEVFLKLIRESNELFK